MWARDYWYVSQLLMNLKKKKKKKKKKIKKKKKKKKKKKEIREEQWKWQGFIFTCQHTPSAVLLLEPTLRAGYDTRPSPDQHFFCWCSKPHKAVMFTPKMNL